MAKRNGPVHVATTTRHYKGKTYRSHLLRRSFRHNGKVKHETLGNISHLPDFLIDIVRRALKGEVFVNPDGTLQCLRSRPHGHVAAILGTLNKLGLHSLLERKPSRTRDVVTAMIANRVLNPSSKLATARALNPETALSSLGEALQLGPVDENELYAALDWLGAHQHAIEKKLARRHLADNTLVLYDITSSYFEGKHCPLAKRGYSRDKKQGKLQIVIGLLTDPEGRPVAVEVFPGNTTDPQTVAGQLQKLKTSFGIERLVMVGDRGMLTAARIREDLQGVEGLRWISSLRKPMIRKLLNAQRPPPSLFEERDLFEITADEYPGERLIVCRNPKLAAEQRRKREDLLQSTEKLLQRIADATQRKKAPLRGKDKIGTRFGKVIDRYKVGKFFTHQITDTSFSFQRNQDVIRTEAALAGIYVVRSNVEPERFDAPQTVRAYKDLARVERAFRCLKTIELLRPIHHWREDRVRAHVLLCMLAYYVEWHMRRALAPVLFEDHHKDAAQSRRRSIVATAQRSHAAQKKAAKKRTEDDLTVQAFRDLLENLGTIVINTVKIKDQEPSFPLQTQPSPLQQRCFDLLGVKPRL